MMKKYLILMSLGVLVLGLLGPIKVAAAECSYFKYGDPLYRASGSVTFIFGVTDSAGEYKIEVDCEGISNAWKGNLVPYKDEDRLWKVKAIFTDRCIFAWPVGKKINVSLYFQDGSIVCTNQFEFKSCCRLSIDPLSSKPREKSFTVTGVCIPSVGYPHLQIDGGGESKDVNVSVGGGLFSQSIGKFSTLDTYTVTFMQGWGQTERSVSECTPVEFYITESGKPGPGVEGKKCDECLWCEGDPKPVYWDECNKCVTGVTLDGESGTWTALGCIPNKPEEFVAWILARAVGIGGGIAFLLMLWGGFQVITSAGDPQKLNDGKDILVSAAAGLLFIIFALFLLRIVGVDILGLPGFNP